MSFILLTIVVWLFLRFSKYSDDFDCSYDLCYLDMKINDIDRISF